MAKRKTQYKISYYVACNHFLVKDEEEIRKITTELETLYKIEVKHETKWAKNKDKHGVQIDYLISSDTHTKLQLSKIIDSLHENIFKTTFKDYIEVLKDESSSYLSQKLFLDMYNIEVGLRSILKKILISVFGAEWKKKIFDDNFKPKRNENRLESLTLEELYYIMFVNRRFLPHYDYDKLNSKKSDELVTIIKDMQILTFWERFFPKIKLKEKICELIKYRNTVMHFKGIRYKDYDDCKKLCLKISPLIEKANNELEMESMVTMLADEFKKIDFSGLKAALLLFAEGIGKMLTNIYESKKE